MKTTQIILATFCLALLACGGGDDTPPQPDAPMAPDASAPDSGTPDAGTPAVPTLGAQIDRMGRPAINTALNETFNPDMAMRNAAKDAYNQNDDPSTWVAGFLDEFNQQQGIIDALDTVCGNALGAGPMADATRYDLIGGALASDMLFVKSDSTSCGAYLAVEANALGVIPNNECGGRTLAFDVIDTSVSVLVLAGISGVSDTINANDVEFLTSFPYMADPH